MSTQPDYSSLPRCLSLVLKATDRLEALTRPRSSSSPDLPLFPKTDRDPKTIEDLNEIADQAVKWQVAMFFAYETLHEVEIDPSEAQEEEAGVLWHFGPPDGPFLEGHPSLFMGPLPAELRRNPAAFKVMQPDLYDVSGYYLLERSLSNWPTIRETILLKHHFIVRQSLALVGWVREATTSFVEAQFPEIFEDQDSALPRGKRRVSVRHHGATHAVELTAVVHLFLRTLARDGRARQTRTTKVKLFDDMPQLRGLIHAVDSDSDERAESEAVYAIDPRMKGRIHLRD